MNILTLLMAGYGFLIGASLASFGCVVAERVPAGRSIRGRSACACGRQLKARENIPVLGWLMIGGVARCCGAKIPVRYLWWETVYGVVWAGLGAWVGAQMAAGQLSVFAIAGVLIVFAIAFRIVYLFARPAR